jgi:hypothetical protein
VEDWKIESAAIPGHEVRRVTIDAVIESSHQFGLVRLFFAEAPHSERVPGTQRNRYCDDTVLMQRQKIAARLLLLFEEHRGSNRFVRNVAQVPHAPTKFNVGYSFYIKGKAMHFALLRCFHDGASDNQARVVRETDMPTANTETLTYAAASI